MSGMFDTSVEVDRPVEHVFAYLADGRNDPEFSPRVQSIEKTPDGPTAVGTVFRSTVKDAGVKSSREFRITALEPPHTIRWTEQSKNLITAEGGYDLEPLPGGGTRVRIFNELDGHGLGKLLVAPALRAARKDAPDFGRRIKAAVERS
ncbi:SRPBCC family protein [Streptomyces sp. BE303]|uniref:SRPBCC family protein n=1 Tax=Streptomyces sp. BE303 TaxID=3002528 RepID=UPI002E75DED2|nr:SRPBCC family protein [Streptomyces sp. BE303]MED7952474.1 SRPBCC family protein [Streptomyces sp. BE303]